MTSFGNKRGYFGGNKGPYSHESFFAPVNFDAELSRNGVGKQQSKDTRGMIGKVKTAKPEEQEREF